MIKGYFYLPECSVKGRRSHQGEREGDIIQNPNTEPPYLIVDHRLESMLILDWPIVLWEAEALAPFANEQLRSDCGYTRTTAVRLLKRLPASLLFGARGAEVAAILDEAAILTRAKIQYLSTQPANEAFFSQAWAAWRGCSPEEDHCFVLMAPSAKRGKYGSPVGQGLTILSDLIHTRARELEGEAAFMCVEDPDGDDDEATMMVLKPEWAAALHYLLCLMMEKGVCPR